jgi:DNA (cytosine-5)-methyltransferase 1
MLTPAGKNAWYLDELIKLPTKKIREELKTVPWYYQKIDHLGDRQLRNMIEKNRLHCTKARMSHIYRRLRADLPAYTLTGSGGGGTHVYHWSEFRALSNRERARLQGFPDDFIFRGTKEEVRKQIGMAAPPIGVKKIFEEILGTMARADNMSDTASTNN